MPGVKKNAMKSNTQEISLVPEKDQPYPLPEGWKWVRLGSITQIVGGGTPPSKVKEYYEGGDIPWLSPVDLSNYTDVYISRGKKMITANGLANSSARMMPAETVCLSSRAPIGYVAIAKNPLCTNQGFKSFLPSPFYRPRFLYWYLKGNKPLLESYASGTTFLELSGTKAAQIEFPLPPLEEQERIVTRIESLFAKLDEAKEKAEAVLDTFENRKAAILHKAFTGELTAKWREDRGIAQESWKKLTLKDVAKWGSGGTPSRKHPEYYTGDIAWVKTGELNNEYLYETEEHITPEAIKNSSAKLFPKETVIIAMYGATIGQCAILGIEATTNQACACAVAKPIIDNKFLFSYLLSQKANFINLGKGGAQPNISQTILKDYPITLPTLIEQQSKEAAEAVLEQIDLMKKAILAKAFRGELGN